MFRLAFAIVAPAVLATGANAALPEPQSYDEVYWAAKWARWEASCNRKDAIFRFSKKYGPRFQALRSQYVEKFLDTRFPDLPVELVDGTIVWNCQRGYHNVKERTFVRILKRQEIEFSLRKR